MKSLCEYKSNTTPFVLLLTIKLSLLWLRSRCAHCKEILTHFRGESDRFGSKCHNPFRSLFPALRGGGQLPALSSHDDKFYNISDSKASYDLQKKMKKNARNLDASELTRTKTYALTNISLSDETAPTFQIRNSSKKFCIDQGSPQRQNHSLDMRDHRTALDSPSDAASAEICLPTSLSDTAATEKASARPQTLPHRRSPASPVSMSWAGSGARAPGAQNRPGHGRLRPGQPCMRPAVRGGPGPRRSGAGRDGCVTRASASPGPPGPRTLKRWVRRTGGGGHARYPGELAGPLRKARGTRRHESHDRRHPATRAESARVLRGCRGRSGAVGAVSSPPRPAARSGRRRQVRRSAPGGSSGIAGRVPGRLRPRAVAAGCGCGSGP